MGDVRLGWSDATLIAGGAVRLALGVLLLALVLCMAGCGGAAPAGDAVAPADGAGAAVVPGAAQTDSGVFPLPRPSAVLAGLRGVKQASSILERDGSDFVPGLCQRLSATAPDAIYGPAWLDGRSKFDTVAYGIYRFDLTARTGRLSINTQWKQGMQDFSVLWLGAGNWERDRWDWYSGAAAGAADLGLAGLERYRKAGTGELLVAVVVLGQGAGMLHKVWAGASHSGDWSMYRRDARHGAQSYYAGPDYPALKWRGSEIGQLDSGLPAFDADGTLYATGINSYNHRSLFALHPDGTEQWCCDLNVPADGGFSSPAVAEDGTVYVAQDNGYLYAVKSNGVKKWRSSGQFPPPPGGVAQPLLGPDSAPYLMGYDPDQLQGHLYALDAAGVQVWDAVFPAAVTNPVLGAGGALYTGCRDGNVYAVAADGKAQVFFDAGAAVLTDPAVGSNGTLYVVSSADNVLHAVSAVGVELWRYALPGTVDRSPAIAADGSAVLGCADGWVYMLAPDGTLKWKYYAAGKSGISLDANGAAYVAGHDGRLYAIGVDGVLKWWYAGPIHLVDAPVLGEDGTVYYRNVYHELFAVGPGGAALGYTASGVVKDNNGTALAGAVVSITSQEAVVTDAAGRWEKHGLRSGHYIAAVTKAGYSFEPPRLSFRVEGADTVVLDFIGWRVPTPEWQMQGKNAQHTRRSTHTGPATPIVKWHNTYPIANCVLDPSIDAAGVLYFSLETGGVYALNPDGSYRWAIADNADGGNGSALGPDGTLYLSYLGEDNRILRAFTPAGVYKWSFALNWSVCGLPVVAPAGTVYICGGNAELDVDALCALRPDGTLAWQYQRSALGCSPVLDASGNVYSMASIDGQNHACKINPAGEEQWLTPIANPDEFFRSVWATIADDKSIIFGSMNHVYALQPDGTLLWEYTRACSDFGVPAIATDGTIHLAARDHYDGAATLLALNSDGTEKWAFTLDNNVFCSPPTLDAAGVLYVGGWALSGGPDAMGQDHRLYAINPDATLKWTFDEPEDRVAGVAIGTDGTLYFGDAGGNIFALGPGAG